jgi:MFS family permease
LITGDLMKTRENKFYGWTLVCLIFIVYLINNTFPYYGASVINTYMAKSLEFSKSILGLGFSIFTITLALSSPLVGYCVTKFGARLTLTLGGLIIMLGSMLMASTVTSAWLFILVFGIVVALGVNLGGPIPAQTLVTYWFKKRKAIAMSIVLSAAGIGAIIATPLMSKVISFSHNWKAGWILVLVIVPISTLTAAIGVRNKPGDLGQLQDGISFKEKNSDLSKAGTVYQTSDSWVLKDAIKTKALWIISFASIAFLCVFVTCVAHSLVHLQALGCPENISAFSLGLMVLFSIIGRLLAGGFGDRIEPRIIWSIALCFSAAGMLFLMNYSSLGNASIYLYAFCIGVGFGGAYVSQATLVGNYYGAQSFASIQGTIFPIMFLIAAAAPYIAGLVYDLQGTYNPAFIGIMILAIAGAFAIFFVKPPIPVSGKTVGDISTDSQVLLDRRMEGEIAS